VPQPFFEDGSFFSVARLCNPWSHTQTAHMARRRAYAVARCSAASVRRRALGRFRGRPQERQEVHEPFGGEAGELAASRPEIFSLLHFPPANPGEWLPGF
jgi:hypothetical protein